MVQPGKRVAYPKRYGADAQNSDRDVWKQNALAFRPGRKTPLRRRQSSHPPWQAPWSRFGLLDRAVRLRAAPTLFCDPVLRKRLKPTVFPVASHRGARCLLEAAVACHDQIWDGGQFEGCAGYHLDTTASEGANRQKVGSVWKRPASPRKVRVSRIKAPNRLSVACFRFPGTPRQPLMVPPLRTTVAAAPPSGIRPPAVIGQPRTTSTRRLIRSENRWSRAQGQTSSLRALGVRVERGTVSVLHEQLRREAGHGVATNASPSAS